MNIIDEIEELISKMDLTPAMYKNAMEKYDALKGCLKEKNPRIVFYPHGSLVLGTTVRPYREQKERNYDLDSVCLFNCSKDTVKPVEIKNNLESILKESENYKSKLKKYDRCITIEYADYGVISFSIDIAAATVANDDEKNEMLMNGCKSEYVLTAIDVAEVGNENERWISSNPVAYAKWFAEINKPFADYGRNERTKKIYDNNRDLYNSIEDVPEYFNKTALQKAIQLLKRSRDVYFSKLGKEEEKLKPISAIITTIVANVAKSSIPSNANVLEVVKAVIEELKIYSKYQKIKEDDFKILYGSKVLIKREKSQWSMWNPVNTKDNLVDMWNKDSRCAKLFFSWVENIDKTIDQILDTKNIDYTKDIGNLIGSEAVIEYFNLKKPQIIEKGPKPWKM